MRLEEDSLCKEEKDTLSAVTKQSTLKAKQVPMKSVKLLANKVI